MSRASLARMLTSVRLLRFRLFCHGLAPLTYLLFCLSPTFKEHVSLPIEVTSWAFFQTLACQSQAVFIIGSAKVRILFKLPNFSLKISVTISSVAATGPAPFGLGVQKYRLFLTIQIFSQKMRNKLMPPYAHRALGHSFTGNYSLRINNN